jgi:hypothetical protein
MKSTLFRRLSDETVVEVKLPRHVLIDRLLKLSGACSETDSAGDRLVFYCSKKGRLSVESYSGHGSYNFYHPCYVAGEVLTEQDKTVVKVYTVHRRFYRTAFFILIVLLSLYLMLRALLTTPSKDLFAPLAIGGLSVAVFIAIIFSSFSKATKNRDADIEKMRQEVLNRLEAARRWED